MSDSKVFGEPAMSLEIGESWSPNASINDSKSNHALTPLLLPEPNKRSGGSGMKKNNSSGGSSSSGRGNNNTRGEHHAGLTGFGAPRGNTTKQQHHLSRKTAGTGATAASSSFERPNPLELSSTLPPEAGGSATPKSSKGGTTLRTPKSSHGSSNALIPTMKGSPQPAKPSSTASVGGSLTKSARRMSTVHPHSPSRGAAGSGTDHILTSFRARQEREDERLANEVLHMPSVIGGHGIDSEPDDDLIDLNQKDLKMQKSIRNFNRRMTTAGVGGNNLNVSTATDTSLGGSSSPASPSSKPRGTKGQRLRRAAQWEVLIATIAFGMQVQETLRKQKAIAKLTNLMFPIVLRKNMLKAKARRRYVADGAKGGGGSLSDAPTEGSSSGRFVLGDESSGMKNKKIPSHHEIPEKPQPSDFFEKMPHAFKGFSVFLMNKIIDNGLELISYEDKELILKEGEVTTSCYYIAQGACAVASSQFIRTSYLSGNEEIGTGSGSFYHHPHQQQQQHGTTPSISPFFPQPPSGSDRSLKGSSSPSPIGGPSSPSGGSRTLRVGALFGEVLDAPCANEANTMARGSVLLWRLTKEKLESIINAQRFADELKEDLYQKSIEKSLEVLPRAYPLSPDFFRKVPLFKTWAPETVMGAAKYFVPRIFKRNDIIFTEGQPSAGVYIILTGSLGLYRGAKVTQVNHKLTVDEACEASLLTNEASTANLLGPPPGVEEQLEQDGMSSSSASNNNYSFGSASAGAGGMNYRRDSKLSTGQMSPKMLSPEPEVYSPMGELNVKRKKHATAKAVALAEAANPHFKREFVIHSRGLLQDETVVEENTIDAHRTHHASSGYQIIGHRPYVIVERHRFTSIVHSDILRAWYCPESAFVGLTFADPENFLNMRKAALDKRARTIPAVRPDQLSKVPLLHSLPRTRLERLCASSSLHPKVLEKGTLLTAAHQPIDHIYLIASGDLKPTQESNSHHALKNRSNYGNPAGASGGNGGDGGSQNDDYSRVKSLEEIFFPKDVVAMAEFEILKETGAVPKDAEYVPGTRPGSRPPPISTSGTTGGGGGGDFFSPTGPRTSKGHAEVLAGSTTDGVHLKPRPPPISTNGGGGASGGRGETGAVTIATSGADPIGHNPMGVPNNSTRPSSAANSEGNHSSHHHHSHHSSGQHRRNTHRDETDEVLPWSDPNRPLKHIGGSFEGLLLGNWTETWRCTTVVEVWSLSVAAFRNEFNALNKTNQAHVLQVARTEQQQALGLANPISGGPPPLAKRGGALNSGKIAVGPNVQDSGSSGGSADRFGRHRGGGKSQSHTTLVKGGDKQSETTSTTDDGISSVSSRKPRQREVDFTNSPVRGQRSSLTNQALPTRRASAAAREMKQWLSARTSDDRAVSPGGSAGWSSSILNAGGSKGPIDPSARRRRKSSVVLHVQDPQSSSLDQAGEQLNEMYMDLDALLNKPVELTEEMKLRQKMKTMTMTEVIELQKKAPAKRLAVPVKTEAQKAMETEWVKEEIEEEDEELRREEEERGWDPEFQIEKILREARKQDDVRHGRSPSPVQGDPADPFAPYHSHQSGRSPPAKARRKYTSEELELWAQQKDIEMEKAIDRGPANLLHNSGSKSSTAAGQSRIPSAKGDKKKEHRRPKWPEATDGLALKTTVSTSEGRGNPTAFSRLGSASSTARLPMAHNNNSRMTSAGGRSASLVSLPSPAPKGGGQQRHSGMRPMSSRSDVPVDAERRQIHALVSTFIKQQQNPAKEERGNSPHRARHAVSSASASPRRHTSSVAGTGGGGGGGGEHFTPRNIQSKRQYRERNAYVHRMLHANIDDVLNELQ